ncbi:kinetochore protein Ndc80 [Cavenderia fasciculata]|uniref:Kinetochore protein NDC80 n=1 Tax=Cavenderia fasciculata TaxID=261658 RepID=F4QE78_CACFS|nr:kinetochore protein Ndc80 [Cavenderia fasciculata]EGG14025.1 kinetochore protein Ndc80 [Cavenderia fasciculata]|eukprot:XP_004350733.1 kinetochore protein Ndc80 [Cavenderia fasciculata]
MHPSMNGQRYPLSSLTGSMVNQQQQQQQQQQQVMGGSMYGRQSIAGGVPTFPPPQKQYQQQQQQSLPRQSIATTTSSSTYNTSALTMSAIGAPSINNNNPSVSSLHNSQYNNPVMPMSSSTTSRPSIIPSSTGVYSSTTTNMIQPQLVNNNLQPPRASLSSFSSLGVVVGQPAKISVGSLPSSMGQPLAPGKKSTTSIGGTGASRPTAGGTRQDARNVTDKAFQKQCIIKLVSFLTSHNYPSAITTKELMAPSAKDFYDITEFLFHHIDSTFKFTPTKKEDELIAFFKIIKYPVTINKRNLNPVGTQHNWPYILAALAWIADLIEYDIEVANVDHEIQGEEAFNNIYSNELIKSYTAFLCGDDVGSNAADNFLEDHFGANDNYLREESHAMLELQSKMRLEIESINNSPNNIEILKERKQLLENDKSNFEEYINELQVYKSTNEKIFGEHQIELLAREKEFKDLQQQKSNLEAIVSDQQSRSLDAKMIHQKHRQLQDDISKTKSEKKRLDQLCNEKNLEIAKLVKEIEELLQSYNVTATKLGLLSSNQKQSYQIDFNFDRSIQQPIINDLKLIKVRRKRRRKKRRKKRIFIFIYFFCLEKIKQYIEEQIEKKMSMEEENTIKENESKQLDDLLSDNKQQLKRSEQKLSNLENVSQREKDKNDKELKQYEKKFELKNRENEMLKEQTKKSSEEMQAVLEKTQQEYEKQKEDMERITNDLKFQILKFLEIATNHQSSVSSNVKNVLDHMKRSFEQLKEPR